MSLSDLCGNYVKTGRLKDDVDRNIIEFAEAPWGLGLGSTPELPPISPAQKFVLKCYYNIPLDNTEKGIIINDKFNEQELYRFTEMEYLNFLWNEGRINIKEVTGDIKKARNKLILVIGRRGRKTSTTGIISSFEAYKLVKKYCPQEYYGIPADDEIRITCVATNEKQAAELFQKITGHLERSEYFSKFRHKPTLGQMQLITQRDIEKYAGGRSSVRIVASPCSSKGLRGPSNIVVVLDELAHFFESETSEDRSDEAVYKAVAPSTAKFSDPDGNHQGRVIAISSPSGKTGKFWEIYERSLEADCEDWLMIQAPTWEMDPSLSPKFLRGEFMENPITYMSEYGAQFSDRVSGWIENEQMLRVNIIPGLKEKNQTYERVPHFIGTDVGLKNDGTAIAVTHITKQDIGGTLRDAIELDCCEVRYAKDEGKEYFSPEDLADWFHTFTQKFYIVKGMMDQYYGMAIQPLLVRGGCKQFEIQTMSREFNSRVYQNLMSKMLDCSLRIPEGNKKTADGKKLEDIDLVTELLRLQATVHNKYIISVEAPESKGAHDDLSDAYARSVWLASEFMLKGGSSQGPALGSGIPGSGMNYRRYYQKAKMSAIYTNRPSSSIQMDMARGSMMARNNTMSGLRRRGF